MRQIKQPNSSSPKGEYQTSDLYYGAYLAACGVPILRHERLSGVKIAFIFDASLVNIQELQDLWINKTGQVSAQVYASEIKRLKGICHLASSM